MLSGEFFASVLPTWMLSFQDHEASDIIRNCTKGEKEGEKYLSSDVRIGPSTLINREERFKANCSLFKSQYKSNLI